MPTFNISTGNQQVDDINRNIQQAIQASTNAQTNLYNQQAQNQMATINQAANSQGLLYSTLPAAVQTQYTANTYMPALSELGTSQLQTATESTQKLLDVANQIRALNAAAQQLNAS